MTAPLLEYAYKSYKEAEKLEGEGQFEKAAEKYKVAYKLYESSTKSASSEVEKELRQGRANACWNKHVECLDRVDKLPPIKRKREKEELPYETEEQKKEFEMERPSITLEDVGDLEEVKKELMRIGWIIEVYNPELQNEEYRRDVLRTVPKGYLLYGPPGTGKTYLMKALAGTYKIPFIVIRGPEIERPLVGESERILREIFDEAKKKAPCIIFFDEVDAVIGKRGTGQAHDARLVNQFLSLLEGFGKLEGVIVVGSTNRLDMIDEAAIRSGRLEKKIYIPLPDEHTRGEILKVHLRDLKLVEDIDIDEIVREIAAKTEGFSGADMEALCRNANERMLERVHAGVPTLEEKERRYEEEYVNREDFNYILKFLEKQKPS